MAESQVQGLEHLDGVSDEFKDMVRDVRMFMRDYPSLNRLVKDEEHTDRFIAQAILSMLSDFAGTPPPLGWFSLTNLINNEYMWAICREGVISFLLKSLILLMQRNALPFNDGGLSVDLSRKTQELIALQRQYEASWENKKVAKKKQMNIAMTMGAASPGSEYALISSWATLR